MQTTIWASILLAGCATHVQQAPAPQTESAVKPSNITKKTSIPSGASPQDSPPHPPTTASTIAPPAAAPAFTSPFLKKITQSDLKRIQTEARRVILPIWATIDVRASRVGQRVRLTMQQLNAPLELAFIPVAESGYQPYALSPAGALGLWQLMPKTAIELGAKHRNGIDGRRHVEESTKAAVTYLLGLHQRFDSWVLAICAYNLGPWGVQRRLRKSPWTYQMGLDALPFPAETRHYVKQILGMIALHELGDIAFSQPTPTTSIQVQAPIDLRQLSTVAKLEKNELFRFNPGLDYQHYLRRKLTIHLPQENTKFLQQALQSDPKIFTPKHMNITSKKGDSLWRIARRYHTSIRVLRTLNPHLKHTLAIGEHLTVPSTGNFSASISKINPLLSQGRRIRYKVRHGDSLWKIAKKFGTSSRAIARANQMSTRKLIRPGERLWVIARLRPS